MRSLKTTIDEKSSQIQLQRKKNEVQLEELQILKNKIKELETEIQEMKELEDTRKISLLNTSENDSLAG